MSITHRLSRVFALPPSIGEMTNASNKQFCSKNISLEDKTFFFVFLSHFIRNVSFYAWLTNGSNKLECFSLATIYSEVLRNTIAVIDAPYLTQRSSTSTTTSTWCSTPPGWPRPLTRETRVSGRPERD
jgi:hypothetical protein